jgi:3-mercaptopyruvate sulfurtransferase SseA
MYERILGISPPLLLYCSAYATPNLDTPHIPNSVLCRVTDLSLKWLNSSVASYKDRDIVCYQEEGLDLAATLWWLLRVIGCDQAAVLDGGLQAWQSAGHPVDYTSMKLLQGNAETTEELYVDLGKYRLAEDIDRLINDSSRPIQLLDTDGSFKGAIHCPASLFLTSSSSLLDPATCEVILAGLNLKRNPLICTLVVGDSAPIVLLALSLLLFPNLSLGLPNLRSIDDTDRERFYSIASSTVFHDAKGSGRSASPLPTKKQCSCLLL